MPNHKDIYGSLALSLYCAATEWFFYGINAVLFWFCVKTLHKCRVPHRCALSVAVSVIFLFCTLHAALQLVNAAELMDSLRKHHKGVVRRRDQINIAMGALYVTNNLIADGIFIYRCYGIWNFRKRMIAVPIILLIATGCLGYAGVIACGLAGFAEFLFINWLFPLEVVFSVMTNTLLMALTGKHSRHRFKAQPDLINSWPYLVDSAWRACNYGPEVVKQYKTVMAMILESGALYCTTGLLYLMFLLVSKPSTQVIFAALAQVVGIAPTIIIVRVGLGNSVDSVESFSAGATAAQADEMVVHLHADAPRYWNGKQESV
ncbi:hypothetical protein C8R43DRAFT_1230995 [Mycena crocata]|nr:hypothetical protein C8R43DRAFT_1230995 [Mycena crocata]